MASANPFYDYVEDLFSSLGQITTRRMFGGAGVYSGEAMFALLDDEQVYLKTDAGLKAELEAKGGAPFEWTNPKTGKTMTMSYVSLPTNAMDDSDEAAAWGRKALDVALKARQAKVKSPRRSPF